jgi:hypothetical protein
VNFAIVQLDHHFLNSPFFGNGHRSLSGFLKNNNTKELAIHLKPLW